MNRHSTEVKVGIFFLAAIAIFAFVWFRVLDFGTKEGFMLKTHFNSVEGLVKGAQVQIAGVRIGKVKDIRFDAETGKALVEMAINDAYRNSIPEGSRVSLKTKGMLGDKYIVIEPGKPNARKLKDGEEINLVYEPTDTEKVLDNMGVISQNLQVLTREARKQIIDEQGSKKIASIIDNSDAVFKSVRGLLSRNAEKIDQSVDSADKALKDIRELVSRNKSKLNRTVDGMERFSGDMEKFSAKMDKTGGKFSKVATDLDIIARDIRAGKGTLGKLVTDDSLYRDAHSLVKEVKGVADRIQNGPGTVGRLINDPEIYFEARRAIRNMNKTAEDVSEATPVSTLAIILGSVFR